MAFCDTTTARHYFSQDYIPGYTREVLARIGLPPLTAPQEGARAVLELLAEEG